MLVHSAVAHDFYLTVPTDCGSVHQRTDQSENNHAETPSDLLATRGMWSPERNVNKRVQGSMSVSQSVGEGGLVHLEYSVAPKGER